MRKALGRRAILLHLSGFPCQYQRRVVDTKIYHHKCFSYYTTILTKLFSPVKNLSKPLFREQFLIDREVEIFEVCGGRLADTPGFASLEAQKLARIPKEELQHTFPEFEPYFGQCRFTGCSHRSETGCAVRAAVEAGKISPSRYASYLALYEEANARKAWEP